MLKVMIVENDLLMADMLDEILVDGGFQVCGIARTVGEAVALVLRNRPDIALLDLRLIGGELGTQLVPRLDRTGGMGILYVTGNGRQIPLSRKDGEACLDKPYRPADVIRAVKIVDEIIKTGKATGPFPHGFRLLEPAEDAPAEAATQAAFPAAALPAPPAAVSQDDLAFRDMEIVNLLRQQAALAAFGSFALGETDLEKVLTEAARVCAEIMGVPFCKVCRYRAEEKDLIVEAGVGWRPGIVGWVVSQADTSSPQGRAFVTGQPVICGDLRTDTSFMLPSFYADHGIVSTLDVVIKTKEGQAWGILEIDNPEHHQYNEHDVNFCTGFANVLAEAVNTSKRYVVAQAALVQMKDMVADRDRLVTSQTRLLAEKGILAQELQHRVRNNLQFVYGMLNKQIQSNDGANGVECLAAIARRVMTLAKVYDHLLGADLTRTIDFGAYLVSLCDSFKDMETQERDIKLNYHTHVLIVDLDTATALGLIVAELVSNCYRHAFPQHRGTIDVSLKSTDGVATLRFADDGVGFEDVGATTRRGLGLVRRLMEQVDGTAKVETDHGTVWTLTFPVPALTAEGPVAAAAA